MNEIKLGIKGHFTLEKECSITGKREKVADFDNLITDTGLNALGLNGNIHATSYVRVGTGNTSPSVSDSSLVTQFAATGRYGTPNYSTTRNISTGEIKTELYYRFNIGTFDSTVLSEIGVGWDTANTASLFSRALIVDELGEPTTITVLSTEYLYVTYTISVFVPVEDFSGSITIGSTTYNYTGRAASFNSSALVAFFQNANIRLGGLQGYSGSMGSVTGLPSGTAYVSTQVVWSTYSAGTFYLNGTNTFSVGTVRSIKSLYWSPFANIYFQFEFDTAIAMTALQVLTLTLRISWARV